MLTKLLLSASLLAPRRAQSFSMLSNRAKSLMNAAEVSPSGTLSPLDWQIQKTLTPISELMRFMTDGDSSLGFPSLGIPKGLALSMDVKETEKSYEVHIDVPGIHKGHIKLSVNDHILTIDAERKSFHKGEHENIRRIERFSGHAQRSIQLPTDAEEDKIVASQEHGVLSISIPRSKTAPTEEAAKLIEIK